jgi:hypothetical protein
MSKPYDILSVPESPTDALEWFLSASPGGFPCDPQTAAADAVQSLSLRIRGSRKSLVPKPERVEVFMVERKSKGGPFEVRSRGFISRVRTSENERPGKIWKKLSGGRLVSSFLRQGIAFRSATDREVLEAAAITATAMELSGDALRRFNDWLCGVSLLARAGFSDLRPDDLPHPWPQAKPKSSNPVVIAREAALNASP